MLSWNGPPIEVGKESPWWERIQNSHQTKTKETWTTHYEVIEYCSQKILAAISANENQDGCMSTNLQEILKLLRENHFPDSDDTECSRWEEVNSISSDDDLSNAKIIETEDKDKWTILDFCSFKLRGLDGFYPALLQWSLDTRLTHLAGVFSASLALEYISKAWRESKVSLYQYQPHIILLKGSGEADRKIHKLSMY